MVKKLLEIQQDNDHELIRILNSSEKNKMKEFISTKMQQSYEFLMIFQPGGLMPFNFFFE